MKYLSKELSRKELENYFLTQGSVCYESVMLEDWAAYAGIVHSGERKGQPMRLRQVQTNSLCLLTTRNPGAPEKDRIIFAVFLVDEGYEGDNREAGFVTTDSKYRVKFSPAEAEKLLFWNYHANNSRPERPAWSSGLHRYLDDFKAVQILQDMVEIKKNTSDEVLAQEFLEHFVQINAIDLNQVPEKNGALIQQKRIE